MRVVKSLIRSLVASPKQLHYDPTTDLHLDLSYITPRLIVTSAPVSSYWESWYRYPLDDLLVYLNSEHQDNWHLFNFRGEGAGYSYEEVAGKVSHYPFPDHYPPTMEIIINCVSEMDKFLTTDDKNIAVLHCKAGKGRSGTLCCAYLIYQLKELTVSQILHLYTRRRMNAFAGEGISIMSQKRYLEYWYRCVHEEAIQEKYMDWSAKGATIDSIRVKNLRTTNAYSLGLTILEYIKQGQNTVVRQLVKITEENSHVIIDDSEWVVYKLTKPTLVSSEDIMIGMKSWCYLWFNIFFESANTKGSTQRAKFVWVDFDGFKGTSQKGSRIFDAIEIDWFENSN